MKTVTSHLLESGKENVENEACGLLASSCVSQECKVNKTSGLCHIGEVLPCNSLHWVGNELVLISASCKDVSALQFSCNKIDREKREGLIW